MSPRRRDQPPSPTQAALLTEDLRVRILSGELPAGLPLREEALATETGLSRHTVRTALAALTAERLVIQEPHRGIRVTSFSADDLRGLTQVRSALEAEAVRLTRQRHGTAWPPEVTGPIHAAMQKLETLAVSHPNDWPTLAAAHASLHRAIVSAAQSPRLSEEYARLDSEMLLLVVNVRPTFAAAKLVDDHRDYLDQLQRDGEDAVHQHLERGTQEIEPRAGRAGTAV